MAPPWKTFQRIAENLVFNEAPKFIRQQLQTDTVARGIQQGIKLGIDAIVGAPPEETRAITAGRPVSQNFVPTAHRARKVAYAPDLDGQADPGEIVWTWVVYEDDPSKGKDRPVLVVGRDRTVLLGSDALQPGTSSRRPQLGEHRQRQLGLREPGELGAAGPGARCA